MRSPSLTDGEAVVVFTRLDPRYGPKEPPEGSLPCPHAPNVFAVWHGPEDGVVRVSNELIDDPALLGPIESATPWPLERCGVDGSHITLFRRAKP